ncbi:lipopolysaccharide/colanic/teichoic acid biosynthesis glycosyltransferase [Roseovarius sp. MBR-78]
MKHEAFEINKSSIGFRPSRLEGVYARWGKPAFDIVMSLCLLPVLALICLVLLCLNPFFNRGPLFYMQPRMGRGCRAFSAIKFRSMTSAERIMRSAEDPLEHDRITPLGRIMRRCRVDELPQIINVLRGEMSLIGPRPDYFHHARRYVRNVAGYRRRHDVRPGISGLAQTDLGYVDDSEGTRRKVVLDLRYVDEMSLRLDLYVFWRTLVTVCGRKGC